MWTDSVLLPNINNGLADIGVGGGQGGLYSSLTGTAFKHRVPLPFLKAWQTPTVTGVPEMRNKIQICGNNKIGAPKINNNNVAPD